MPDFQTRLRFQRGPIEFFYARHTEMNRLCRVTSFQNALSTMHRQGLRVPSHGSASTVGNVVLVDSSLAVDERFEEGYLRSPSQMYSTLRACRPRKLP